LEHAVNSHDATSDHQATFVEAIETSYRAIAGAAALIAGASAGLAVLMYVLGWPAGTIAWTMALACLPIVLIGAVAIYRMRLGGPAVVRVEASGVYLRLRSAGPRLFPFDDILGWRHEPGSRGAGFFLQARRQLGPFRARRNVPLPTYDSLALGAAIDWAMFEHASHRPLQTRIPAASRSGADESHSFRETHRPAVSESRSAFSTTHSRSCCS
jgi:hypothetical protein